MNMKITWLKEPEDRNIKWLKEPEDHNYPAAESYLSLLFNRKSVKRLVKSLKKAKLSQFKSKDIFRASKVSLLGISNSHVEKDRQKIKQKKALSPILLVRDSKKKKVIIADGYHRLCAVYSYNEDAFIPCKIGEL